jgi:hypothetical protein
MSIPRLAVSSTKNNSTGDQYWSDHLVMQKKSGLSMTAYCREHQLNYDRFYYWVRKEKQPGLQLIPIELKPVEPIAKSVSAPSRMPTVLCTLTFRAGSVLQVHDKEALPLILSALS